MLPSPLLVSARALQFPSSVLPAGVWAFSLYGGPPGRALLYRQRRLLMGLAAVALLSGLLWFALVVGAAFDVPHGISLRPAQWALVLHETRFGTIWQWRLALLTASMAALAAVRGRDTPLALRMAGFLLTTAFACLLAAVGHAGASGSLLRLCADALHLLAAGLWIGGLLPLRLALGGGSCKLHLPSARRLTERFSTVGLACVGTLMLTGVINASPLGFGRRHWLHDAYGRMLLAKLAVFATLLVIAARNRWSVTPRLRSSSDTAAATAVVALRRAIVAELLGAALVFIIVGALGATRL